jgi:hypothetical protein
MNAIVVWKIAALCIMKILVQYYTFTFLLISLVDGRT